MFIFRHTSLTNGMAIALVIFLFNVSVDPPDLHNRKMIEDLTINEIESIVELTFETIFGIEDFIPEGDDADQKSNYQFVNFVFKPEKVELISSQDYLQILEITNCFLQEGDLTEGVYVTISPP
ncbi:MAG: hypothetical protein K8H85_03710, partial [Cyclobacteriaceae bacterium]|nr:hypothetical protein [Cyclobacteriaceae bacterium]